MRPNRYIWLGTNKLFDAFTFDFRKTDHGWFQAHIYKFDENTIDLHHRDDGRSLSGAQARRDGPAAVDRLLPELFSEVLEGAPLMTNARHLRGSAWLNFQRLICGKWSHFNGNSHVC